MRGIVAGIVLACLAALLPLAQKAEGAPANEAGEEMAAKAAADAEGAAPQPVPKPGLYVPPPPEKRVAGGRIGGGTRAARPATCGVKVTVVAPLDHVGLTLEAQPTLYYFLSDATSCPVEFVLNDRHQAPPLVEAPVKTGTDAGLHAVRLVDFGVSLEPAVEYEWFVQVKASPDTWSLDTYAGAQIRRVPATGAPAVGPSLSGRARARALAQDSIFYDAVAVLSAEIEATPDDAGLREEREVLFEAIGIGEPRPEIAP